MKKMMFVISVLFIISGLMLLNYNLFLNKTHEKLEEELLIKFFDDYNENKLEEIQEDKVEQVNDTNNYVAVIEVPTISLKTGIVMSNSSYSTMNKNVSIFPDSDMPTKENGNFILFAHRGSSRVSYFKDIYKLKADEEIYIYYNNSKYTYKVINKYNVSMYDHTPLNKMSDKTIITLITCKKNDNKYRTIIVGELVK